MASTERPVHDVAIALVRRDGRWLVARRHAHAHLGGLWEFPGGKIEPGEAAVAAALREVDEECGVRAAAERVLDPVRADYGDRIVHITPVVCAWQEGEARPIGSADCRWVDAVELRQLAMPAVNAAIIAAVLDGTPTERTH